MSFSLYTYLNLLKWLILSFYCVFAFTSGVDPTLNCNEKQMALEHSLGLCLGMCQGACEKAVSQLHGLPFLLNLGAINYLCTPQEQSPGFLQPSYSSHQPSNQARGLIFALWNPRLGHPICGLNHLLPRDSLCPCNPFPLSLLPGTFDCFSSFPI